MDKNVFPKSFVKRVNELAHAKDDDEPLFAGIERLYWNNIGSPLDAATKAEFEAVNAALDELGLTREQRRKMDDVIGCLYGATQSGAFACGLSASSPATSLLFPNGKD